MNLQELKENNIEFVKLPSLAQHDKGPGSFTILRIGTVSDERLEGLKFVRIFGNQSDTAEYIAETTEE